MDRWSQLSLKDKSDLMSLYIKNGISSLEEIKKHYNSYQIGGPIPSKTPNFVQRFNEGNKRDIPVQGGHATHLLSYAERDGKYYVYPEVQPTDYNDSNSPLQYYGRDWRVAFDRAYDNNDYLEFDTEEAARKYSENYKKVPSTGAVLNGRNRGNYNILDYMRGFATGGHLYQDGGHNEPNFVGGATALKKDYNYELEHLAEKYPVTAEGPWHDYGLHNPSSSQRAHWNELSRMYNRVAQRPDYQYLNPTNILEYAPIVGDAIDAGNSIYDLQQGNTGLGLAGLGMLALPNFIEKPLKYAGKSIKGLLKNNNQKQLDKAFDYYFEKLPDIEIQPQPNIRVISEPTVAFKTAPYKNTLKNYHPNWYPAEVSSPTGITHTLSGLNLARIIENSNGMLPAPSLAISPWEGITKGRHPYSALDSDDGLYTFVFNPEYIDNLPHEAQWRDGFTPTYKNAETWAGKHLTPSEVVDAKREIYNTFGTIVGTQEEADFIKHTRDRKPYMLFESQGLQEAVNKFRKQGMQYAGYGEVMPLDFVDLRQAPIVFGEGSTSPIVSDFLKNLNHHKVTSPEMFNIKGLALKNGGKLKST